MTIPSETSQINSCSKCFGNGFANFFGSLFGNAVCNLFLFYFFDNSFGKSFGNHFGNFSNNLSGTSLPIPTGISFGISFVNWCNEFSVGYHMNIFRIILSGISSANILENLSAFFIGFDSKTLIRYFLVFSIF